MSGDEMADEDRSAAPDDGRSAPDDSGSDWFFRDRTQEDPDQYGPGPGQYRSHPDQYGPDPGDHEFQTTEFQAPEFRPQPHDPDATATHYFGPFSRPPGPVDEPIQVLPTYGAAQSPTFGGATGYPAPVGVPPLTPQPPTAVAAAARPSSKQPARRPRTALLLLVAALLAALVGTAAGYGGARLAQTSAPTAAPTVPAQPTVAAPPTSSADPQSPVPAAPSQIDTVQVAASALPSTVMIRVGSNGSGGTGSGFVLDTDGHIMTNNHVIADAADGGRITVMFSDGARVQAELVGRSPSYDLAVIKLTESHPLTPLPVGDSEAVRVGEPVVAIGSPWRSPAPSPRASSVPRTDPWW